MAFLQEFLPIVLFVLGIVLLVVLIILAVRMLDTVDKVNRILDSVDAKVNSLNGVFRIVDKFSENMSFLSERMIDGVTGIINRIFSRKKRKSYDEEDDYYE